MRLKENCGVARYGADKERGESHEWTAGPMAVDNKQLKKYNKNVSLQIDLTWFHPTIVLYSHAIIYTQKIYINFKKYQCNFNKNNTCFTKVLRALLRPPSRPLHQIFKFSQGFSNDP